MKREYDFEINRRNIPNLDLYTKLLLAFYGFLGFNYLLIFLYAKFIVKSKFSIMILFLSVIFLR